MLPMGTIAALLAFCLFWQSLKLYEYSLKKSLHERVSWCAGGNAHDCSRSLPLIDIICNAQAIHNLSKEYRLIEESEQSTAKEILAFFQEYLTQEYFKDALSSDRTIVRKSSEAYFIFALKSYLEKYQCDTSFHEHKMYTVKNYVKYGSWGAQLFDATYILTDYAVVYHKILYIVQLCYFNSLKDTDAIYSVESRATENTKKVLDTKEIEVSRY